ERVHRGSRGNQLLDAIEFSGCARFEQRERCAAGYQQIRDLLVAVGHGSENRAFIFLGARVDEGGIGRDQLFHTTKLSCFDRLEELGFVRLGHGWIVFQVLGFQSYKVQWFKGSRVQVLGLTEVHPARRRRRSASNETGLPARAPPPETRTPRT